MSENKKKVAHDVEPQVAQEENKLSVQNETFIPTPASLESLRHMAPAQRVAALKSITSYIGADSTNIDSWLGKEMPVCGVVVHDATVSKDTVDFETGEMGKKYVNVKRVVFKLKGHQAVSAVSVAATSFVETFLIPAFGFGDWVDEHGKQIVVNIAPRQVSKGDNRTFNFQVV